METGVGTWATTSGTSEMAFLPGSPTVPRRHFSQRNHTVGALAAVMLFSGGQSFAVSSGGVVEFSPVPRVQRRESELRTASVEADQIHAAKFTSIGRDHSEAWKVVSDSPGRPAVDKLKQLAEYKAGWNGPRSNAADPQSFILAQNFVEMIGRSASVESIEPTIYSSGNAAIEILMSGGGRVDIEFDPAGELYVNVDSTEGPLDLDLCGFEGTAIPNELRRYF